MSQRRTVMKVKPIGAAIMQGVEDGAEPPVYTSALGP
jgi:hypothetical protein